MTFRTSEYFGIESFHGLMACNDLNRFSVMGSPDNMRGLYLKKHKTTFLSAGPSGRSPAEIVGSNPTRGMDVCCEYCVLSGRGLCDELITRPEESYRRWCIVECDLETS